MEVHSIKKGRFTVTYGGDGEAMAIRIAGGVRRQSTQMGPAEPKKAKQAGSTVRIAAGSPGARAQARGLVVCAPAQNVQQHVD